MKRIAIIAAVIAIAFIIGISSLGPYVPEHEICKGTAACFSGIVTQVTDGDTIKVDGKPIRLALISTPELHERGGIGAREFTLEFCPVGSVAIVDQDDGQRDGSFGRMIAAVYCGDNLLNSGLLDFRKGTIDERFCRTSEFSGEDWVKRHGC